MRLLDSDLQRPLKEVAMYLTEGEAMKLADDLGYLLSDPERIDHCHVYDHAGPGGLTFSIVTPLKLHAVNSPKSKWTEVERNLLQGKWDW